MSDKRIKQQVKTFLRTSNNMFKQVKTFEEASAILVFLKSNLSRYNIILKEEANKEMFDDHLEDIVQIYLKHTNPHDRKNATMGFIKMIPPCKSIF